MGVYDVLYLLAGALAGCLVTVFIMSLLIEKREKAMQEMLRKATRTARNEASGRNNKVTPQRKKTAQRGAQSK